MPHVTLAMGLPAEAVPAATAVAAGLHAPMQAEVATIEAVTFPPVRVVSRVAVPVAGVMGSGVPLPQETTMKKTTLAALAALSLATPAAAQSVLRVVPHADLRTLDPVAVSVVITRMHGLMIYESLFASNRSCSRSRRSSKSW